MEDSNAGFESLKKQAQDLEFHSKNCIEILPQCRTVSERCKHLQEAHQIYNKLRSIVAAMSTHLCTSDMYVTKTRAVSRRYYDQLSNRLIERIMREQDALKEMRFGVPIPGSNGCSSSSGFSSTHSSRGDHGAARLEPLDEEQKSPCDQASESPEPNDGISGTTVVHVSKYPRSLSIGSHVPLLAVHDHQQQVREGQASLEATSASLERSHTLTVDSDAVEVLTEGEEEEEEEPSQGAEQDLQAPSTRGSRLSQAVLNSLLCNRLLLVAIILLEALVVAGVICWKLLT